MKTISRVELAGRLKQHIRDVLHISIDERRWEAEARLPAYLREAYSFLSASVLGTPCLFALDRGGQRNSPASIKKHLSQVSTRTEGLVVYVAAGVNSSRRRQFIDQQVPFVIPGNQIYLPMLGVDLREHFRSTRDAADRLSPGTQAAFLYALHQRDQSEFSPLDLSRVLGYSAMTMSRAFDELEAAGIGGHLNRGKRRIMAIKVPRRELWQRALPMLRSPVNRRVIEAAPPRQLKAPTAGLSALASYTNLAEPRRPVAAVAGSRWREIAGGFPRQDEDTPEGTGVEVEVWSYAPGAVAGGGVVDRLSLFLSLSGSRDERVEYALNTLLDGMTW